MRILFIHSVNDLYGASRSLLRLASRLAADGHRVCTLLPMEKGPLATQLRKAGSDVILQPSLAYISRQEFRSWKNMLLFPARLLFSVLRTARLVHALHPDLIHSNTSLVLPGGIVGKILGFPHIYHLREIFSEFGRFWPVYEWVLYLFSDCIICNSQATASQFHPRIQASKVRVVHNGYPASEFLPVAPERVQRFRNLYHLNGHRIVGLVGRIRLGRKGQDVFVRAAAALHSKFPDVKFLCIGSPFPGNEIHLRRFQTLLAELDLPGIVVCTGDVDDIQAAYSALDVSVQASVLPESFGGVIVESMALGAPVIATAIGATPELVEDGVNGLLVKANDPAMLAQAIERLLLDEALRQRIIHTARARYLRDFEFETFYAKIISVYQTLPRGYAVPVAAT